MIPAKTTHAYLQLSIAQSSSLVIALRASGLDKLVISLSLYNTSVMYNLNHSKGYVIHHRAMTHVTLSALT